MSNSIDLPKFEMVATALWHIWNARNNLIFKGSKPNARNTMESGRIMQLNAKNIRKDKEEISPQHKLG